MKEKLSLFFSSPADRPPFIGVCFSKKQVSEAEKLNNKLRQVDIRSNTLELFVNVRSNHVNLRLHIVDKGLVEFYPYLEYERREFDEWLRNSSTATMINFGHVVEGIQSPLILQDTNTKKYIYFEISKVYIINERSNTAIKFIN